MQEVGDARDWIFQVRLHNMDEHQSARECRKLSQTGWDGTP